MPPSTRQLLFNKLFSAWWTGTAEGMKKTWTSLCRSWPHTLAARCRVLFPSVAFWCAHVIWNLRAPTVPRPSLYGPLIFAAASTTAPPTPSQLTRPRVLWSMYHNNRWSGRCLPAEHAHFQPCLRQTSWAAPPREQPQDQTVKAHFGVVPGQALE